MREGKGISRRIKLAQGHPHIYVYSDRLVRIEEYAEFISLVYELAPKKLETVTLPRDGFYKKVLPKLHEMGRVPKDWQCITD